MKTAAELIREHLKLDHLEAEHREQYPNSSDEERERDVETWKHEAMEEFRGSGERTGLTPRQWSRHYECEILATKIGETWVAWPHWYGGGKHGCPEDIPWIDDAFYPEVRQETRVVNVFSRPKEQSS